MSTISPTTASPYTSAYAATDASTGSTAPTTAPATAQQTLGQDDFLKLLAQQFQSQDPLKPMDDTSFISQMAQFTSLQQSSAMAKDISAMRADQQKATANSYLGHRVTVDTGNGSMDTGDVTGVDVSGATPQIIVNGNAYSLSAVLAVQPTAVATSTASGASDASGTPATTTTP